jgi:hypothetical protein
MTTRAAFSRSFSLLLLAATLTSCATITKFDQQAYNNAVEAKVKLLLLMDKAASPYDEHTTEIDNLHFSLNYSYEYVKGISKNEDSIQQWDIMKSPEHNLIGGFLKRWEDKKTLKPAFISAAKSIISDGFNAIIDLESGKINPAESTK